MDFIYFQHFSCVNWLLAATGCHPSRELALEGGETLCQLVSQILADCRGAICSLDNFRNLKFYSEL